MAGIYLKELRLQAAGKDDASVEFKPGANLISGPSNTGKTFIYECIEYMLGASSIDRRIKESRAYHEISLEIFDEKKDHFTLRTDFEGGDFYKYDCRIDEITPESAFMVLKREHKGGKTNTLSHFLLGKCGFLDAKVRTNAQGKKRDLSFRDIRILHLVDELRVPTKGSPFLTGQYTTPTVEENVLKLLLTGQDDSHIVESIPEKTLVNKAGKIEVLSELIGVIKEKYPEPITNAEILSQENKLTEAIERLKIEQKSLLNVFKELDGQRKNISCAIIELNDRENDLNKLFENSLILEKQYHSDIKRLKSTIEAGGALIALKVTNCPICNSEVEKDLHSISDISASAQGELNKISDLLGELVKAKNLFSQELKELKQEELIHEGRLAEVEAQIDKGVKNEIELINSKIEKLYYVKSELGIMHAEITKLESLMNQRKDIEKTIASAPSSKRKFEGIPYEPMVSLTKKMKSILNSWGYPDVGQVVYDSKEKDFVISGENRNLAGKGYRALTFTSFSLALTFVSIPKKWRLGICLIDSPLVTYKKPDVPDGEGISVDMAKNFYHSMVHIDKKCQVIVIENEELPQELEGKFHHIHFTKNENSGRYGFIPR